MNTTVTFAGNLTADPELRFTSSGTPVLELRAAVNRQRKTETGWEDAEPMFHTVKVWGRRAENAAESLASGDRINVHGQLETEAWTKDDKKHTKDVVVVSDRFGFIGADLTFATLDIHKNSKIHNRDATAGEDLVPAEDPWANHQ
jgi:single-strand DNA-binding protein